MKVREFIKEWENEEEHNDIDVYDNVCEELGICYCVGTKLTKEGEEHFKEVLDYDIDVHEEYCNAVIDVDDEEGIWQKKLKKAKEFFYSAAGYCDESDYDKWFAEA